MFDGVYTGLLAVLAWDSVIMMIVGVIIGMILGAIPGISGTLGVALAIPFTYGMSPLAALGLLAGIHNGASQGGAIPAILLRIPGTPGSICTSWDGYPLAQQGHAGAAIQLSAISSSVGGVLSAVSLILLAPPLARAALAFGPPEIFWVNVFGLAAIAALLGDDLIKGIIAACFGLLIGTVGIDNVTGHERYTFESMALTGGLQELAIMVGMFCFPPAWELAQRLYRQHDIAAPMAIAPTKGVWRVSQVWWVWLKSSVIGIIIGILPGSAISAFVAYNEAKRGSRTPEKFGHGSVEGLAAAESVNNADNAAAMIPTLTLGIPGSNVAALMLGALLVHGFQPGPQLFRDAPHIVYGYAWAMFITALLLIPTGGIVASRIFAQILRVPAVMLLPMIVIVAVTGVFASENSIFNVYVTLLFGFVGLAMMWLDFPIAPVIIGVVLGTKAEFNLRVAMLMSDGEWSILYRGPICIVLIGLTLLLLAYPFARQIKALFRLQAA